MATILSAFLLLTHIHTATPNPASDQCGERQTLPLEPIALNASSQSVYAFLHSPHFAHSYFEAQCALIHTDGFFTRPPKLLDLHSLLNSRHFCSDASCTKK